MFMWPGFIILFFGAYILIRETDRRHKSNTESTEESSLEILKKEYASGKIDRNEFLEKKKDLISLRSDIKSFSKNTIQGGK